MKSVLKYILPLLCFVALIGYGKAVANDRETCKVVHEVMAPASDACISSHDAECVPIQPASSVNNGQRVQKSSRQNNTSQRRFSAFLRAGHVAHPHLYGNTYFNQHLRYLVFVFPAHRLISFGRLVI